MVMNGEGGGGQLASRETDTPECAVIRVPSPDVTPPGRKLRTLISLHLCNPVPVTAAVWVGRLVMKVCFKRTR